MLLHAKFHVKINTGSEMTTDTIPTSHNPKIPPTNLTFTIVLVLITLTILNPNWMDILDMIKNTFIG